MRVVLIFAALLAIEPPPAAGQAQAGVIGLFSDVAGTNPCMLDNTVEVRVVYVVHHQSNRRH